MCFPDRVHLLNHPDAAISRRQFRTVTSSLRQQAKAAWAKCIRPAIPVSTHKKRFSDMRNQVAARMAIPRATTTPATTQSGCQNDRPGRRRVRQSPADRDPTVQRADETGSPGKRVPRTKSGCRGKAHIVEHQTGRRSFPTGPRRRAYSQLKHAPIIPAGAAVPAVNGVSQE